MKASLAGVTAAAAGAAKDMPDDFRVSITNAPGKAAYPISSFTWLLIPEKIADPAKKKAIMDFLKWMLTDGQTMTAALDYAPLPKRGGGEGSRRRSRRFSSVANVSTCRHSIRRSARPFGGGRSFLEAPARGRRDRLR